MDSLPLGHTDKQFPTTERGIQPRTCSGDGPATPNRWSPPRANRARSGREEFDGSTFLAAAHVDPEAAEGGAMVPCGLDEQAAGMAGFDPERPPAR